MNRLQPPPYPPRSGDLSRAAITARAEAALRAHPGSQAFFKFTCVHCGEHCQFDAPNTLYESGECCNCGGSTRVEYAGFSLLIKL